MLVISWAAMDRMITGPEATVIAKAGISVAKSVREQVIAEPAWPNMHAALMELYQILDGWCEAAAHTAEYVNALVREEGYENEMLTNVAGWGLMSPQLGWGGYGKTVERDINGLVSPRAPFAQRWSKARRRKAARRSLRGMLRIYCPDLLQSFEAATKNRAAWIKRYRKAIRKEVPSMSYLEFEGMAREMIGTQISLNEARDQIGRLISELFPSPYGDERDRN